MSTLLDPANFGAPTAPLACCRADAQHLPDAEGYSDQPLFNAA